jgi:type VII secretion system ESX-1 transmembrane protein EccB
MGIEKMMPRNDASRDQVSRWRFLFHRLSVAFRGRAVHMIHDRLKNNSAALLASAVGAVPLIGLCFMLAVFNSAGQIGSLRVRADRASGWWCDAPEVYR